MSIVLVGARSREQVDESFGGTRPLPADTVTEIDAIVAEAFRPARATPQARALAAGRTFVEPDDVKAVAVAVLAHRLILAPEARSAGLSGDALVQEALEHTPVPV